MHIHKIDTLKGHFSGLYYSPGCATILALKFQCPVALIRAAVGNKACQLAVISFPLLSLTCVHGLAYTKRFVRKEANISVSIMHTAHLYYSMYQYFLYFYGQIKFHFMELLQFNLFISGWLVGLFPLLHVGCYKQCSCGHSCSGSCVDVCFQFSWVHPHQGAELFRHTELLSDTVILC